ncbi:MAG: lysine--tRNA ligase [Deltaproteobacteria bacterium]|nr:lysine--tRNA ligase [Deltaproteobacteria bacterium]MBW2069978.1 lysine--tRNA ligase [Deltaproteobacteria bacterium]
MATDELSQLLRQRRQKAERLRQAGVDIYCNDFAVQDRFANIKASYQDLDDDKLAQQRRVFVCAGRIMAIRSFGRASFVTLQDATGRLQIYVKKEEVGQDSYGLFRKFDIGDLVGVKGTLFRTRTGELTLLCQEIRLLTKSLRPLPEKYHGFRDVEARYRQRYVDLIVNEEVRQLFVRRAVIIEKLREFLQTRGFLEVETPMMQPIPGGATAKPFTTFHNALGIELYLRVAPELYLKRLLVGGFEKVFELNRNFRNEGISFEHNPEFTMLEFYQAYATYEDLMRLSEEMFCFLASQLNGDLRFSYQGMDIDLTPPWRKLPLYEALVDIGGLGRDEIEDSSKLMARAESLGIATAKQGPAKIITKLFDVLVEPKLIQPTFITHYPVEVSPLARRNVADPSVVDRFELFIGGREIANGFSELNDPDDQRTRFMQQVAEREAGDEEAHFMDEDYLRALEYGMPPAAGEGVGIDRVIMLFTNRASIREVILFPHMRPERS